MSYADPYIEFISSDEMLQNDPTDVYSMGLALKSFYRRGEVSRIILIGLRKMPMPLWRSLNI